MTILPPNKMLSIEPTLNELYLFTDLRSDVGLYTVTLNGMIEYGGFIKQTQFNIEINVNNPPIFPYL